jgi:hypothetical protein
MEIFTTRTPRYGDPERFPAKWIPVRVKKTRQNKEIEPSFRFNRNGASRRYFTASNSTSNIKVAFGGIAPPAPRAP